MYQHNITMCSDTGKPTCKTIKGKVTAEGHQMKGEFVGVQTLNRRLNGAPDYDVSYKVLVLGDSGVGKTALLEKIMGRPYNPYTPPTVGIDFITKIFDVDGVRVQLQIWDTAGQERFRTMTKMQYRGTKGVALIYDITDQISFDMLEYWLDSIDQEIDSICVEPVPVYIIGNKLDLGQKRAVKKNQGENVTNRHYCRGFMETSAKDGANVEAVFSQLAQAMLEIYNPKLMDMYLSPSDRKEKYDKLAEKQVCNAQCACGGIPATRGKFKLKPEKEKKSVLNWKKWKCWKNL